MSFDTKNIFWYSISTFIYKKVVISMKEYEIVAKFYNACAGTSRPQTFFEEAMLENTEDYVRTKHGKDFDKFTKEISANGREKGERYALPT